MIKRATILKHLKYHNKYERSHFTKKKAELEEICKKLGIDLNQNIDDQTVKAPVKEVVKPKNKVVIQEPDDSSDDESSDEEPVHTTTPSPKVAVPKKLSRKQNKIEKLDNMDKNKSEADNKVKVNTIIKDLNKCIKDLFSEFEKQDLDQDDVTYIQNEFNLTLNEAQDLIDPLVATFTDSDIAKIEGKIDLMYKKLDRFLS